MSNDKQTNNSNGERVAGTGLSTLTPRETSATPPLGNGPGGEKAEQGNRNKRS